MKNTIGRMIAGTPKQMKEKIEKMCEAYGVNEIVISTMSETAEERMESFRLLAKTFDLQPRDAL